MADDMFFTADMRALRRGRRLAQRTPVCRPCAVWPKEQPDARSFGVVLDINRFGMRIRMMEVILPETVVLIQLMRDDDFEVPLAEPVEATVARVQEYEGLSDHGVRIHRQEDTLPEARRPVVVAKKPAKEKQPSRMYMLEVVRRRGSRRTGRERE